MSRRLMYLLVVAVTAGLCATASGQQSDFDILIATPAPVIDGEIDPVWATVSKQYMTIDIGEGPRSNDEDCSGYFQVLYDQDYLYALIDVNDSELNLDNPLADGWQDDSAEFYIDATNSKAGSAGADAFQYRFNWNPEEPSTYFYEYFHRPDSLEGVEAMMVETKTGYRYEVKFPWTSLLGQPGAPSGKLIGIDCFINDDDSGGGRDHQVAWHATDGTGWNTPSMWGTGMLIAPLKATGPSPRDGATDVTTPLFRWTPGRTAAFHDLYLGTAPDLGPEQLVGPHLFVAMYWHVLGIVPGTQYYWRVDEIEKDGVTIHTGDVWTFMAQPKTAFNPDPANGANDAALSPTLTWLGGIGAIKHHLYFSGDVDAVTQSTAEADKGELEDPTFVVEGLEPLTTYYWRVDEIAPGTSEPIAGELWNLTTALPVDDFEAYTDDEGSRIYESWIDGYTNGNSGSTVGYIEAPFAEQGIVHGGLQSMPFDYNNVNAPFYSEAELEFTPTQDWTTGGIDTLVLYVRGKGENKPAPMYVGVEDTAGKVGLVAYPEEKLVNALKWVAWRIPLSEFGDAGVNLARVKKLYVGVGDKDNPVAGATGLVFIDDIRLAKPSPEMP